MTRDEILKDAAWEDFAAAAAEWIDRAGASLAELVARFGVTGPDTSRHALEERLTVLVGAIEERGDIRPADDAPLVRAVDRLTNAKRLVEGRHLADQTVAAFAAAGVPITDAAADDVPRMSSVCRGRRCGHRWCEGVRKAELAARNAAIAERHAELARRAWAGVDTPAPASSPDCECGSCTTRAGVK